MKPVPSDLILLLGDCTQATKNAVYVWNGKRANPEASLTAEEQAYVVAFIEGAEKALRGEGVVRERAESGMYAPDVGQKILEQLGPVAFNGVGSVLDTASLYRNVIYAGIGTYIAYHVVTRIRSDWMKSP